SRRSMRSMKDLRCSFAKPDLAILVSFVFGAAETSAAARGRATPRDLLAVGLLRMFECRLFFGCDFGLVFLLPFGSRHAIDDFARLIFFQRNAFFRGCLAIPIAQTIAAEASSNHQIDVLHIGAFA